MDDKLVWLVLGYSVASVCGWWRHRKEPFGLARVFPPLGIFVWGDALVVGSFWVVASGVLLWFGKSERLMLVGLVFWWVRALGEMVYWLNEQFARTHRNKPEDLPGHEWLPGEAVYFGYQVFWQMVLVVCSLGIGWCLGWL